jgi:hypothetical protein
MNLIKGMFPNNYLAPPGNKGTISLPSSQQSYTFPPEFVEAFACWSNKILTPIIAN